MGLEVKGEPIRTDLRCQQPMAAQDYAVLGHSGESAQIPFVEFGRPPANRASAAVEALQTTL